VKQPPAAATHNPTRIGHPRLHLRRTGSTNERARELAFAGAPHGTLVTADEQTAGRGRQGRRWSAPPGSSLLASLLLREVPTLLPLIAAVAVCDVAGEQARIKWPNDVVVEAAAGAGSQAGERGSAGADAALAKLAGILVEGRPYPEGHGQEGWAVLGIGLNVAVDLEQLPAELRAGADGLTPSRSGLPAATLGLAPTDVEPMLARLLETLGRRLAEPAEVTLQAWRERDALCGREIAWGAHGADEQAERGRALGIDENGRLVVALADGARTTIGAGEVHLRRVA
jgi:BirA family transcriptional regulator, biotin operon repressor / biotin---[acetyl-CoA-carboxylase] ligase